jgi:hypothetical protein
LEYGSDPNNLVTVRPPFTKEDIESGFGKDSTIIEIIDIGPPAPLKLPPY